MRAGKEATETMKRRHVGSYTQEQEGDPDRPFFGTGSDGDDEIGETEKGKLA